MHELVEQTQSPPGVIPGDIDHRRLPKFVNIMATDHEIRVSQRGSAGPRIEVIENTELAQVGAKVFVVALRDWE